MVYTFSDDQESFNNILSDFDRAFSELYEGMESFNFKNLLQKLVIRLRMHDPKWFKNLNAVRDLLSGSMLMIEENKVPDGFNTTLCTRLLMVEDSPQVYLDRPAQII